MCTWTALSFKIPCPYNNSSQQLFYSLCSVREGPLIVVESCGPRKCARYGDFVHRLRTHIHILYRSDPCHPVPTYICYLPPVQSTGLFSRVPCKPEAETAKKIRQCSSAPAMTGSHDRTCEVVVTATAAVRCTLPPLNSTIFRTAPILQYYSVQIGFCSVGFYSSKQNKRVCTCYK